MASGDGGLTVYRYVDEHGTVHITDDATAVPSTARGGAQIETLPPVPESSAWDAAWFDTPTPSLHIPSAIVGAGGLLVLIAVARLLRGRARTLLKVAGVATLVVLAAGLYLGTMRGLAGLGSAPLANPAGIIDRSRLADPSRLVDDAREAADAMNRRNETQKRALERIEGR